MTPSAAISRDNFIRRGQQLEYFTIGYNSAEGLVSIVAGIVAGSTSLIGFGLDSIIEVTSGAALLWRLHQDVDHSRREQVERTTLRIVGWCFVALAAYILYESGSTLIGHDIPQRSIPGIIVAAVSVVVMPLLGESEASRCCRDRKRSHASRFPADGFLHVPVCDPIGRLASECVARLVVG